MPGATGISVRVVSNRLPALPPEIHAAAVAEVERSAREVETLAKERVPVLTGTLRRSITTTTSKGGLAAAIGPSVDYGIYVEYGTRRMAARPYMRPAAEVVRPRFVERMSAALRKVH